MNNEALIEWLFENGGPVIRYLTAAELADEPCRFNIKNALSDLLNGKQVQEWLCRLRFGDFHGSRNTAFENVTGKLSEFGVRAKTKPLDEKMLPFQSWLKRNAARAQSLMPLFNKYVVCTGLALTGYLNDSFLKSVISNRIEELYQFTRNKNYEIYASPKDSKDIPAIYRDKPVIKTEMCTPHGIRLPLIYDIYALAHFRGRLNSQNVNEKINTIIDYILDRAYHQSIRHGYGYIKDPFGKRRYYSLGWSVHLPAYDGLEMSRFESGYFIQRLELFSHFPPVRRHPWFQRGLSHLESYKTQNGTWIFPRQFLNERSSGYWMTGAYMGLEENRKTQKSIELESTFRMLRLLKRSGQHT